MDATVTIDGVIHRVICSDYRNVSGIERCDTLVWDPPWDAGLSPPDDAWTHVVAFGDGATIARAYGISGWPPPAWLFTWDCASSWYTQNRPLRRQKNAAWFGPFPFDVDCFFVPKSNPVRRVSNSRGDHVAGDPRGTRMSDVYQSPITALHGSGHRHAKPPEWVAYILAGIGARTVYDPCAGGGATAVACAVVGIPSVSVEIDADNASAIVDRLMSIRDSPSPQRSLFNMGAL